jgi:arylsulfatase A-like enzyme
MKWQLHRCIQASIWAAVGLAISVSSAAASRKQPDILFISIDTVRADFLTFRDSETAPNMTALARDGTILSQAVSGSSWTLPAHAQMFTGTPPAVHRVLSDSVRIDPRMSTLPEMLQSAGYYTMGFFSIDYLRPRYGFGRGFDVYASTDDADESIRNAGLASTAMEGGEEAGEGGITSPSVVALARQALEGADPDKPLFLFAHFFDPHYDFIPPPPWDTKFDRDYTGDMDGLR